MNENLKVRLQLILEKLPTSIIAKASVELSHRYRNPERDKTSLFIASDADRLAYLACRFPATYASVHRVLLECKWRCPTFSPTSMSDIGAGPGTATFAALDIFSSLNETTLYERDTKWLEIGKSLMHQVDYASLKTVSWKQTDLNQDVNFTESDMMIMSYVVGELSPNAMIKLVDKALISTKEIFVVIEPGTPHGFERIKLIRTHLIEKGMNLVAPCPHNRECPMEKNDWCHFSERVERSHIHMAVKGVTMGYEDEKFSYIIASKTAVSLPESRIVRHPQHHSGHVDLVLCGQNGLEKKIVSKKHGPLYKQTRKSLWGDAFPPLKNGVEQIKEADSN